MGAVPRRMGCGRVDVDIELMSGWVNRWMGVWVDGWVAAQMSGEQVDLLMPTDG